MPGTLIYSFQGSELFLEKEQDRATIAGCLGPETPQPPEAGNGAVCLFSPRRVPHAGRLSVKAGLVLRPRPL